MFFRPSNRPSLFDSILPVLRNWLTPAGHRLRERIVHQSNRLERRMSRRGKIVGITLFCLVFGGYSTTLLVQSLTAPSHIAPPYLHTAPITRPKPPHLSDTVTRVRRQHHVDTAADSISLFPSIK